MYLLSACRLRTQLQAQLLHQQECSWDSNHTEVSMVPPIRLPNFMLNSFKASRPAAGLSLLCAQFFLLLECVVSIFQDRLQLGTA